MLVLGCVALLVASASCGSTEDRAALEPSARAATNEVFEMMSSARSVEPGEAGYLDGVGVDGRQDHGFMPSRDFTLVCQLVPLKQVDYYWIVATYPGKPADGARSNVSREPMPGGIAIELRDQNAHRVRGVKLTLERTGNTVCLNEVPSELRSDKTGVATILPLPAGRYRLHIPGRATEEIVVPELDVLRLTRTVSR